ncbi:hypothetical protein MRBLMR1_003527 [Neorhizobium sp. LMR1-1-1.1]|jgi:hypothetical protein
MGRPKKDDKLQPVLVRFATETLERIDAVAGSNRRAAFIREAVETALTGDSSATEKQGALCVCRAAFMRQAIAAALSAAATSKKPALEK